MGWVDKERLAQQLADLDPEEIVRLREVGLRRREAIRLRREAARLPDVANTVRYDRKNNMFLLRIYDDDEDYESAWDVYYPVLRSGDTLPDESIDVESCPIVGVIP